MRSERWRPNNRVTFNKWEDCERCGLPWPEPALKIQKGTLVCPECWDEKGHADYKREGEPPETKEPHIWEADE